MDKIIIAFRYLLCLLGAAGLLYTFSYPDAVIPPNPALEEMEGCIGTSEDPVEQIALKDAMNAFLRSLPNQSRQIFALRYWHFYGVAEIAKHLGIRSDNFKFHSFVFN